MNHEEFENWTHFTTQIVGKHYITKKFCKRHMRENCVRNRRNSKTKHAELTDKYADSRTTSSDGLSVEELHDINNIMEVIEKKQTKQRKKCIKEPRFDKFCWALPNLRNLSINSTKEYQKNSTKRFLKRSGKEILPGEKINKFKGFHKNSTKNSAL